MSNSFYTNVEIFGNSVLIREVVDGVRHKSKLQWQPTLFIQDNSSTESEYKSLYGDPVKEIVAGNIRETKEFIKQYEGVDGFNIFGQLNYTLQFLNDRYEHEITPDMDSLSIWSIDIETRVPEDGFPKPETATGEIVLITMQNVKTKSCYTFGTGKYSRDDTVFESSNDEYSLLKNFLMFWERADIDIITGWNIEFFDIPYIINRVKRILGEDAVKKMSPWGFVSAEMRNFRGKEELSVDIKGIAILDYLALYKKFTYTKQESYSLKFISSEELGHTKVDLPGETFNDNIDNHWDEFVHYNIVDTQLVTELESKLKLLELIITMAYQAKINFTDVFSPVKMWDSLIHNSLLKEKIVVPQRAHVGSRPIEGAYVKEPKPGKYNWIISLDATSLYPSIMMSLNISPETFAGRVDISMDSLIKETIDVSPFLEQGYAISPIGALFKKDQVGILPRLIKEMMASRKTAKNQMLSLESDYQTSKDDKLLPKISALNNKQMAAKIALNSLYGATANEGFRFFNPDVAESITMTGQFILKKIENEIDFALNKKFGTGEHKYLVYVDTDSVYVNMEPVVKKFLTGKNDSDVVKSLEKVAKDILQAEINKICGNISDTLGFFENKIHFKLEAVGDIAIWCAKKKYIVRVHSSEGVTYAKPKFKVMGLEMVRSSTPAFIRSKLKESLVQVFDGNEKSVQQFIDKAREEFNALPIESVAFPRTANSIDEYYDASSIYKRATPIHVRGVLLYNEIIKRKKLQGKYPLINDGDKIKFMYLKMPNPLKENVIAIPADGSLPKDLALDKYVDYSMQFEKSFLSAMNIILEPIGWNAEETSSLDEFFG